MVDTFCLIQTRVGTALARIIYAYLAPRSLNAFDIAASGLFELVVQLPDDQESLLDAWYGAISAVNVNIAIFLWTKLPHNISHYALTCLGRHAEAVPLINTIIADGHCNIREHAVFLAGIGLVHDSIELVRHAAPHVIYTPSALLSYMRTHHMPELTSADCARLEAHWFTMLQTINSAECGH